MYLIECDADCGGIRFIRFGTLVCVSYIELVFFFVSLKSYTDTTFRPSTQRYNHIYFIYPCIWVLTGMSYITPQTRKKTRVHIGRSGEKARTTTCRVYVKYVYKLFPNNGRSDLYTFQDTYGCHYNAVIFNMILLASLQILNQDMNQTLKPQKIPDLALIIRASHGVSFVKILEKIDRATLYL